MKSIKKYIAFLLVLSLIIASLAGCASNSANNTGNNSSSNQAENTQNNAALHDNTNSSDNTNSAPAEPTTVRIGSLTGPTTIGLLKLYKDADEGKTGNKYEYQIAGTADELSPLFIKGELDVLSGPVNLAAVLNSKTEGKVQMIAVTTLGVLYILSMDENVKTWEDMKGKTIYATGKGSTPEAVLTYLLDKNGLEVGKDVTVEFKSEPAEIVALLKSGNAADAVVMLPQPFATAAQTQVEGLSVKMDLTEEWNKAGGDGKLLTACLMVRKEFAEQNPEAVETLLKEFTDSVNWVNSNVDEAAALAEKYIGIKEGVAKKAIPLCNVVSITGADMKTDASGYLKVLYDQNPSFVGGKVPEDSFYYIGK